MVKFLEICFQDYESEVEHEVPKPGTKLGLSLINPFSQENTARMFVSCSKKKLQSFCEKYGPITRVRPYFSEKRHSFLKKHDREVLSVVLFETRFRYLNTVILWLAESPTPLQSEIRGKLIFKNLTIFSLNPKMYHTSLPDPSHPMTLALQICKPEVLLISLVERSEGVCCLMFAEIEEPFVQIHEILGVRANSENQFRLPHEILLFVCRRPPSPSAYVKVKTRSDTTPSRWERLEVGAEEGVIFD